MPLSRKKKAEMHEALAEEFVKERRSGRHDRLIVSVFVIISLIAALLLAFNTLA